MKKNKTLFYLYFLLALVLNSCVSSNKVVYFKNNKTTVEKVFLYEPKIQVGDILNINVSAVDGESVLPFNLYDIPITNGASYGNPITYLVDIKGEIHFPVIGTFKVAGLSTKELTNTLIEKLKVYIKNPTINVRIENFKISVLGEVKKPGTYKIENERISVLEALGLAGDLNLQANRKNITLVREVLGERKLIKLDLTNQELFNSPYFYLAQNDVLYVAPNKTKINSSVIGANTSTFISSISILITVITILFR